MVPNWKHTYTGGYQSEDLHPLFLHVRLQLLPQQNSMLVTQVSFSVATVLKYKHIIWCRTTLLFVLQHVSLVNMFDVISFCLYQSLTKQSVPESNYKRSSQVHHTHGNAELVDEFVFDLGEIWSLLGEFRYYLAVMLSETPGGGT